MQELENKRKERAQVAYERRKQLNKLKLKAEKTAEEKLGSQLDVLASVKYLKIWQLIYFYIFFNKFFKSIKVQQLQSEVQEMRREMKEKDDRVENLEKQVKEKDDRLEKLEEQVALLLQKVKL